ncbi:Retrovirus-related Pol polyprotein from type-2 retrotransposable element R2DM, partial [Frankliniella fusca]
MEPRTLYIEVPEGRTHLCPLCKRPLRTLEYFREHIRKRHGPTNFELVCRVCKDTFPDKRKTNHHLREHDLPPEDPHLEFTKHSWSLSALTGRPEDGPGGPPEPNSPPRRAATTPSGTPPPPCEQATTSAPPPCGLPPASPQAPLSSSPEGISAVHPQLGRLAWLATPSCGPCPAPQDTPCSAPHASLAPPSTVVTAADSGGCDPGRHATRPPLGGGRCRGRGSRQHAVVALGPVHGLGCGRRGSRGRGPTNDALGQRRDSPSLSPPPGATPAAGRSATSSLSSAPPTPEGFGALSPSSPSSQAPRSTAFQAKWLERLEEATSWADFEAVVTALSKEMEPPRRAQQRRGPPPQRQRQLDPQRLQQLYRSSRAKAMRVVREEASPLCPVPQTDVADHFEKKGFMPSEGCLEHNFILQQCIDEVKVSSRHLAVAWLDLRNAFGSVPHSEIFFILKQHGVHPGLISIIKDLYMNCTTTFSTLSGETRAVPMLSGVKQGDPLSPIVFILAIELLIRAVNACNQEHFELFGKTAGCLAFADDLVLLAKNPTCLQRLLDVIGSVAEWMGLQFNGYKCATLVMHKKKSVQHFTSVQGQAIPSLGETDSYRHLGVPTGCSIDQTPEDTLENMIKDLHRIERSVLTDWQKVDAIRTFVVPQVEFCLQTARVKKGPLVKLDSEMKRGANILPLSDLADIGALTKAFKMLTCPDPLVREVPESSAKRTVARSLGREPLRNDLAAYLSGAKLRDHSKSSANVWTAARNATRRLSSKITGLAWEWSPTLSRMSVVIPLPNRSPDRNIIDSLSRSELHKTLRRGIQHYYHLKLAAKTDQGKVHEVAARDPASNHYLAAGRYTRFCDWRFVHRARLGVLPLRACIRVQGAIKVCRVCNAHPETTAHVLCHCAHHSRAWNNRHRSVLKHTIEAMSELNR